MAILVNVAVPIDNAASVQAVFEQCCKETGDTLIGRRLYEDVKEVLLVVLLEEEVHIDKHVPVLVQALQQRLILSYQFEHAQLVTLRCSKTPSDIRNIIQHFPLLSNESWFPAIHDENTLYLCIHSKAMHPQQENWLNEQDMTYHYM